jgi:hypothetical protein
MAEISSSGAQDFARLIFVQAQLPTRSLRSTLPRPYEFLRLVHIMRVDSAANMMILKKIIQQCPALSS